MVLQNYNEYTLDELRKCIKMYIYRDLLFFMTNLKIDLLN
ncbi:hypothetical protein UF72_1097 [Staphylococcus equorum subsp. equorum]|nr:hypothetical protein UF72_1097 [Staphylococcus equorum subsp. equorum]